MAKGLHNDADTKTNGQGLSYSGGNLTVGIQSPPQPDPNKPAEETIRPKSSPARNQDLNKTAQDSGSGAPVKGAQLQAPAVKKAIEDLSKPSAARGQQEVKEAPVKK